MSASSVLLEQISDVMVEASRLALIDFSKLSQVETHIDSTGEVVPKHWMVVMLLSGKLVQISFKSFFNLSDVQVFSKNIYAGIETDRFKQIEFLREFSNLASGKVKSFLESNGLTLGFGIPIVTRGFDEIFFSNKSRGNSKVKHWVLKYDGASIFCRSEITLFSDFELKVKSFNDKNSGDVSYF